MIHLSCTCGPHPACREKLMKANTLEITDGTDGDIVTCPFCRNIIEHTEGV